jgi:pimeloyl-ACP methyl ester carboxylesterase
MVLEIRTGTRLDVKQLGEQNLEPLLMLPATVQPWGFWEPLAQAFAQRYRVIGYGQLGIGKSEPGVGPISIASLAEDAIGLLDALEIGRAHVLGWSIGSAIAQEMAIHHADRVGGLVLWGTWAATDTDQQAAFTAMRYPWTTGDLMGAMNALSGVFSPEFVSSPSFAAGMAAFLPALPQTQAGMGTISQLWDADIKHDTLERLSAIAAPTLVVAGEQDTVTPVYHARAVAERIPSARLELLRGPGSSHAVGLERASEFVPLVLGFLAGCPLGG